MAKRRKKLRRRLYTFEQLERKIVRAIAADRKPERLYGNVILSGDYAKIDIVYQRTQGKALLASVFRMSDGDTGYVVHGYGRVRNTGNTQRFAHAWMRYAHVFTPIAKGHRLPHRRAIVFRLRNGEPQEVSRHTDVTPDEFLPAGCSLEVCKWRTIKPKDWISESSLDLFPRFKARALAFYRSLRKRLSAGMPAEVQLTDCYESNALMEFRRRAIAHGRMFGICLAVSTPPTRTQTGRRLHVLVRMHDKDSRAATGVDFDYGTLHCHVLAVEYGQPYSSRLEWKSARAALVGIHEWVNGTLYIPGPSH